MKLSSPQMLQSPRNPQTGAIMVLCLVILFSMTLIGVSSMDSAVLELKMSNTMQQQVVALNRAEATLQSAEDAIDAITADAAVFDFDANDGFYPRNSGVIVEQADWSAVAAEDGPRVAERVQDARHVVSVRLHGQVVEVAGELATTVPAVVPGDHGPTRGEVVLEVAPEEGRDADPVGANDRGAVGLGAAGLVGEQAGAVARDDDLLASNPHA